MEGKNTILLHVLKLFIDTFFAAFVIKLSSCFSLHVMLYFPTLNAHIKVKALKYLSFHNSHAQVEIILRRKRKLIRQFLQAALPDKKLY